MTLNTRNDPAEGVPYAVCQVCDTEFTDKASANEHMSATVVPVDADGVIARGHRLRITNPTRAERVTRQVERILTDAIESEPGEIDIHTRELEITDAAIEQALDELQTVVDRGDLSSNEVETALHKQQEFLQAWQS